MPEQVRELSPPSIDLAMELNQRDPEAVIFALPRQRAVQAKCDCFRRQIVVQSEVALIDRFAFGAEA